MPSVQEFDSLSSFGLHLAKLEIAETLALAKGLEKVLIVIEKTAKSEIGVYQESVGPFPAWAPLADSTEEEKARLGYPTDAPLLRTGDMRESITHERDGLEGVVGSDSDILVYQELGTEKIPPRPVMGPAAFTNKKHIERIIGHAAVSGLLGDSHIPLIGYDFET